MKFYKRKKGFTLVELVIVIAVIAILSAVLIPTFSGIIEKARKSVAQEELRGVYLEYQAEMLADNGTPIEKEELIICRQGEYYTFVNNEYVLCAYDDLLDTSANFITIVPVTSKSYNDCTIMRFMTRNELDDVREKYKRDNNLVSETNVDGDAVRLVIDYLDGTYIEYGNDYEVLEDYDSNTYFSSLSTLKLQQGNVYAYGNFVVTEIISSRYSITYYDINGVAFSGQHAEEYPVIYIYVQSTTLDIPTKTGYTFGGFFTDSACTEGNEISTIGATAYTSNITVYAKWTINTYTLTLSFADENIDSISYKIGDDETFTTVTSNTELTIDHGTTVVLYATPATDYSTGNDSTDPLTISSFEANYTFAPEAIYDFAGID